MTAFVLPLLILVVALSLQVMCGVNEEGFLSYVVYGPDSWFVRSHGVGRRPYWGWRRRFWNGPCPGPWCPYA